METGADNCPLSRCPNARSTECWSDSQALTLAEPSLLSLLSREHTAFALFSEAWAAQSLGDAAAHAAAAARHRAAAASIRETLNRRLWRGDRGYHVAYNTSTREDITSKTYVIAFPLFAGLVNASQAAAIARSLAADDMLSPVGLRSTSSADPRYNNDDVIVPYSNWRGPMWVNANAVAAYGLADYGYRDLALEIASRVTRALAADLRNSSKWHEAYATDGSGAALAAPGFLSWDTLAGELLSNLRAGVNPFKL